MELKVWVEGIQRVICGVTEGTTCQDVVIALAHATGKTGRFTLVEKWRENERFLAPTENPVKVLQKWGEYANEVSFILRHSSKERSKHSERSSKRTDQFLHNFTPHSESRSSNTSIKKSLTFSGAHSPFPNSSTAKSRVASKRGILDNSSLESLEEHSSFTSHSSSKSSGVSPYASLEKKHRQSSVPPPQIQKTVSPFNSLERRKLSPAVKPSPRSSPKSTSTPVGSLERKKSPQLPFNSSKSSPSTSKTSSRKIEVEEYDLDKNLSLEGSWQKLNGSFREKEFRARLKDGVGKEDLMQLVKLQQQKLSVQQSQIKNIDSEIKYWEDQERENESKSRQMREEISRLSQTEMENSSELEELDLVSWADKLDMERQQGRTLQSELTLIRSKLANAESELLSAKNKTHTLNSDHEKAKKEQDEREKKEKEEEMRVLQEIADLQKQINTQLVQHEASQEDLEKIISQVKSLESQILEHKTQIADYEKELMEANMQVFNQPSIDGLKVNEDKGFKRNSPSRPGSTRKMPTSPLLLKETVATDKNPHGMWV